MDKSLLQLLLDSQSKMSEDITDIKVILAKQEQNIEHHVKRTDLAEENTELLRKQMITELRPLKSHVTFINNILKVIGGLGFLVSIVAGIVKIISFFS